MEIDKAILILISTLAFGFSLYNFFSSRTILMYQDLDRLYLEVIKLAITNPEFVDPNLTRDYMKGFEKDDRLRLKYELYAFLVWNVCETIYDRKSNGDFFKTWECIIKVENDLHRNWLDYEKNHCRFKKDFIAFIRKEHPQKIV